LSKKNKQKQVIENFTKLHFSGAKNEREMREKPEVKQRKNRERAETGGAFAR
jgi:hypothetical protein